MAGYRQKTMRQLVIEADPKWVRDSRVVPEYEFSSEKGAPRVFEGDYQKRGPYRPE